MKSIVLYYTLGGTSRKEAEKRAAETGADLVQICETKKRTMFSAFLPGCPNALNRRPSEIKPLGVSLADYDRISICCPVWAGFPAPAFNAVLALIPSGKELELVLLSAGGETPKSKQGTIDLVAALGIQLKSYTDVRTQTPPRANA